ncbi:hypothetical protein TRFO_11583 [Tritrichomonas foetus]|uniref:non-specific serine/threonine protein kinase n=1 Tax=Tritrichomonas foetus TaxID=1144522 RepID=A0A1J4J7Z3_9EUKA|nr:hypothetical protein TRFO_11583 [Tritrichomonas foetus]|eukprot:OHS93779.1 hypothetical protein TRFO_11583 [Tritrichomonas foetus]
MVSDFYSDISFPDEMSLSNEWFFSLLKNVVEKSPSNTIRACSILLSSLNYQFTQRLFPVAFYSCWNISSSADRDYFSSIINHIITNVSSIPSYIVELMEIIDRWSIPIVVDTLQFVKKCKSHQYSVHLIERFILSNPDNMEALDLLMEMYLKIGNISTTKAIFMKYQNRMSQMMLAKWCGKLGDWERALHIYQKENAPISTIIHCLSQLRRADDINQLSPNIFDQLSNKELKSIMSSILWAYLFKGNGEMISKLINYPSSLTDPSNLTVFIFHELSTNNLERVEHYIHSSFQILNEWRNVLSSGNKNKINMLHNYSQILVEADEAIKMKKAAKNSMSLFDLREKWDHRIKGFKREAYSWEMFLVLRNILLPIEGNVQYYLKIIAYLRKFRQFHLINDYFTKAFDRACNLDVYVERIKIIWAAGLCDHACVLMDELASFSTKDNNPDNAAFYLKSHFIYFQNAFLNCFILNHDKSPKVLAMYSSLYKTNDLDTMFECNENASTTEKRKLITELLKDNYIDETSTVICGIFRLNKDSSKLKSKIFRFAGEYITQLYDFEFEPLKKAESYFKSSIDLTPADYKCWKWWAYTNAKLFFIVRSRKNKDRKTKGKKNYISVRSKKNCLQRSMIGIKRQSVYDSAVLIKAYTTEQSSNQNSFETPIHLLMTRKRRSIANLSNFYENTSNHDQQDRTLFDDIGDENAFTYGINSINGFLKAAQLNKKMSLAYLCKMFSIVFTINVSTCFPSFICDEIEKLPIKELLKVVPQMTSHIDHHDKSIKSMISSILIKIGEENFQQIYFPLKLYSLDSSSEMSTKRARIAKEILFIFRQKDIITFSDANLFSDGMIRAAITWFESWMTTIEKIMKCQKMGEPEKTVHILREQFIEYNNSQCDLDNLFKQLYQSVIKDIYNTFEIATQAAESKLLYLLKSLHQSLKEKMQKLSCIVLEKISRDLSAKKHFSIFVPGEKEKIFSIDPILEIIGTQQRPRCLLINSEQGSRFKFLLKGNEDIRVDERLMQFFNLVNIIMSTNHRTREFSSFISCYTVIPITNKVGLIGWVNNADTMHQLISECRTNKQIDTNIEYKEIEKKTGVSFPNLSFLQKLEIFHVIKNKPFSNCEELNTIMWMKAESAASHFTSKKNFTSTSALMSMVGYVIGLGDRHPSNIMIHRETGNIVHIDFGESFDSAIIRSLYPERVPFRLTRMVKNTLLGKLSHGYFSESCNIFMGVMRENQNILTSQLSIFSDDPVIISNDSLINKESKELNLNRNIYDKLNGYKTGKNEANETVEEQVDRLIEQAENPENYLRHYSGWCALW